MNDLLLYPMYFESLYRLKPCITSFQKKKKYISINPESRPGFYPGIPDFSVGIGIQVGSGGGRELIPGSRLGRVPDPGSGLPTLGSIAFLKSFQMQFSDFEHHNDILRYIEKTHLHYSCYISETNK